MAREALAAHALRSPMSPPDATRECWSARAALLACALLALRAPLAAQEAAPPALDEGRAALAIDEERVPWEDYATWFLRYQGEQHVLDFVKLRALERLAEADGIAVEREEARALVASRVEQRVRLGFDGDRDAWREELSRLGQTEELYFALHEELARAELLTLRLVQRRRALGEQELRAAWEREYGHGGRALVTRLLRLTVPPPPAERSRTRAEMREAQSEVRLAAYERALELRRRALAGEPFEQLVVQYSDDAESRARGGLVPDPILARRYGTPAVEALRDLAIGEISAPIYARGGMNLFRLEGYEITPFESVREELRKKLYEFRVSAAEAQALTSEALGALDYELLPEFARAVQGAGSEPQSWRLDQPVLRIGDELVTRGQYAAWLTTLHGLPFVRSFGEWRLVERLASESGIQVGPAEVEQRLHEDVQRRIEWGFRGFRDQWLAKVEERFDTEQGYMRTLAMRARHDLLAEKLMRAERDLSEEMLRYEWEERYGPEGRTPDVRWILRVPREPALGEAASPEEEAARLAREHEAALALLEGLRRRALDGEDFATLARQHSMDPATRDRGGRPASPFQFRAWPAAVQDAIRALRPGELTPPMTHGRRMYLFELVGHVQVPFESVKDELASELASRRPEMIEVLSFVNQISKQHRIQALRGLAQDPADPSFAAESPR